MSERGPVFKPFPFIRGCHAQTIVASFFMFYRDLSSQKRFVHLSDGEKLVLEITTPPNWKDTDPTVVLVHGLCGSHKSPHIIRLAKKLYQKGIRAIRLNLRGCGSGRGHAKRMYHAEASDDVWQALKEIKRDTPHSSLTVIGFSLGGNITLKMAGENGEKAKDVINKVIAINPPIDMHSSIRLLSSTRLYERFFMHSLKAAAEYCHEFFEDLPPIEIPHSMTLLEFIDLYIAPQAGFANGKDYYHACSSGRLISSIAIESHILFARDDPIVDCNVLDSVTVPDTVNILITEHGGHLGYLGIPGQKGGFHWMDSVLFQWIFENRE